MGDTTYFAAASTAEIGKAVAERLQQAALKKDSQRWKAFEGAFQHYYGFDFGNGTTHAITRGGDQGELSKIRVNNARALAKALLAILVGAKMNWKPQAANNNPDAEAATILASNLLEWYWKRAGFSRHVAVLAEQGIVFSEAFLFQPWDETAGEEFAAVGDDIARAGDVRFHNVLPWDVVVDPNAKSYDEVNWWFVTLYRNRWDLAKQFPTVVDGSPEGSPSADKILKLGSSETAKRLDTFGALNEKSDLVPVRYFFHRPTPTLPHGRQTIFLAEDCVLRDLKLLRGEKEPSYRQVPIIRFAADEIHGTPSGYTSFWDALGVQEMRDSILTSIASNVSTLGGGAIAMEKGSGIEADRVHGLKVAYYNPGKNPPQALNLSAVPAHVMTFEKELKAEQQLLLGLNDTALGAPQEKLSGAAYALLKSASIQNNSPMQAALVEAVAKSGTCLLKTLAEFATTERKIAITGKDSESLYTEQVFTGAQLRAVDSVLVDVGSALEQTAAGRFELAQIMLKLKQENGEPVSVEELQKVLDTGRMDPVLKSARNERLLIDWENESLSRGENPAVHVFQNHPMHAREHAGQLANPQALRNKKAVVAIQAHVDWHYREFFGVDPALDPLRPQRTRILLGQMPPPPDVMAAPGAPGAPGAPPATEGGEVLAAPGEQPDAALPQMPMNPLTGQEFNNQDGGGVVPS